MARRPSRKPINATRVPPPSALRKPPPQTIGAADGSRPISGITGNVQWSCGCEIKIARGMVIPAGCAAHDPRFGDTSPWHLELACKLFTDDYGRVWLTDANGDARVVFDHNDTDFDTMFQVIEDGMLCELEKREGQ